MSGTDSIPATPDEMVGHEKELASPGSADDSEESSSAASTPMDGGLESPSEIPKRVPSLRSVSDPRTLNPNSTAIGMLGAARKPVPSQSSFAGSAGALGHNSAMEKARALHQQRMQKGPAGSASPASPGPGGPMPNGFGLRMPGMPQRPGPPQQPNSSPAVPVTGLAARRQKMMGGKGLSLSDMGAGTTPPPGGMQRPGRPGGPGGLKLSDITGAGSDQTANGGNSQPRSQMDDFKKYIDTEKGWITFDGAATITREGVNFSNGQTFSISLDEVEKLDELGKGNYGTVYKVKHTRPRVPRFGHGFSGAKHKHFQQTQSDPSPVRKPEDGEEAAPAEGTTGITMAMKEIRLELDDAKFTTILKELVILHECVSPYIIDFYGAFFQEGAVYICIEYMDGGSIDKLYNGGIPENVLRKITYSTVQGLRSLKDDHNIIHRDVKPTNILVNSRGQVKICDFGVSGNLVASIAKTNIGCQSYMAPERISGGGMAQSGNAEGTYSVQSDIWSLGLTIIECAKGAYPYPPEVSQSIFSQLNAIVEGEPPSLPEEGFSETAHDFVKKCLHKIPKMRPPYAQLLKHPWLDQLSKPQTITEEAEDGEDADAVADAVGKMDLGGTEDEEVAAWVKGVFAKKASGEDKSTGERPALHAAPLDSVSPPASE